MSSASIWVQRSETQWWRLVAAVIATAMVATGAITVLPLTAQATSVGSPDDTAGVFLYNAGSDTQGFQTPPPGPCAGVAATDPTNETVDIAVGAGNLYFIGDEPSEVVNFALGADGERQGGLPDAAVADVNIGLQAIDDYGFVGNAAGASDDNSNFDAQTGGEVTLRLDIDGTFAAPGGTDLALIIADGVTATGTLENDPADPFGNLDGNEIFIFEDAETSGMTIELYGPGGSAGGAAPYVIDIVDYQRNPDTFRAADDTLITIDLDSLPGFTFPYVEEIRIVDDGAAIVPNISTCPAGAALDTSVELDAVATRTDTVIPGPPAIDIEKATNGVQSDVAPGETLLVGSAVEWTYVVTNTGDTQLINVTVTDDLVAAADIDCGGSNVVAGPINPGGTFTCTATGTAVAGQYTNTSAVVGTPLTAVGDPVPGLNVTDEDPSNYIGLAPAIDIEKATNGVQSDVAPGETLPFESEVTWTYVVTNTGTAPLTNVTVTDDQVAAADIDCGGSNVVAGPLAPNASFTCTATGTAILGQYANVSDVAGTPVDAAGAPLPGGNVTDTDPSHYVGEVTPAIDIEKATNGQDADTPTGPSIPVDGTVTWTYVVTNTGSVNLIDVAVADSDPSVTVDCGGSNVIAQLAVNASVTCTASGTATLGQYTNNSTVVGTPADANFTAIPGIDRVTDADPSHYIGTAEPAIDIEKATNGVDADTPTGPELVVGEAVTWTYVVTNTGTTDLINVTVTDDIIAEADIDCGGGSNVVAGPVAANGGNFTCTATGVATAGQYANVSDVVGTPADAAGNAIAGLPTVDDTDPSHYIGLVPSIDLEKATNSQDSDTAPGQTIAVGDAVTWTYTVINTGGTTLTDVTVTDNLVADADINCAGTGSNVIASLAVGESEDCVANGTAIFGPYTNTGDVTGQPVNANGVPVGALVDDTDPSNYTGSAEPAIDIEKATNGVDADTPTGPELVVGEAVTWTYVVTNTGTTNLVNVAVTDDIIPAADIDCGNGSNVVAGPIAPAGGTFTCTATGIAVAGQYANVSDVVGTPADAAGNPIAGLSTVDDTDPSHYIGLVPSVDIEKDTNGQDADTPVGPQVPVGDTVTWTYEVTNNGDVTLAPLTVTDDQGVAIDCGAGTPTIASLAPGDSATCTGTAPAELGQYMNNSDVSGQPVNAAGDPVGAPVTDADPSHYFGTGAPAIDIEKDTNNVQADTGTGPTIPVGDAVTWTYVVTNTGTTPLVNVTVTDTDLGIAVDCGGGSNVVDGPVAPDASFTCSASGSATAGQYNNGSTVTGSPVDGAGAPLTDPTGNPVANATDEDPSAYFGADPSIELVKSVNGADANVAPGINVPTGSTLAWTFVVTNTGNVDLAGVTVSDPQITDVSCEGAGPTVAGPIAPGATFTCTATSIAAAGAVTNTAGVVGTPTGPDGTTLPVVTDDDPANYFGGDAAIDVEKATDGTQADTAAEAVTLVVGDTVTWTYVVTNTGTVALDVVELVDDQGVTVTCPAGNPIPTLAVGATETCTGTGTVTAGDYMNTVTATGVPANGDDPVSDEDPSHYLGADPSIEVEKDTNGVQADTGTGPFIPVGDAVTWTYVITNTGNVTLDPVVLTDDVEGVITCPVTSLAAGGTTTCTATGVATAGQYNNNADVTGAPVDEAGAPLTDAEGAAVAPVTDTDPSAYFGAEAAILLEKATNGIDADDAPGPLLGLGDAVTWTYVVTNTGNVDLALVEVTDSEGVTIDCGGSNIIPLLAPGAAAAVTCTGTGTAALGQYMNDSTAVGNPVDPAGAPIVDANGAPVAAVQDDDPSHYFAAGQPNVDIVKSVNGSDANVAPGVSLVTGAPADFTYVVTNTGDVDLATVAVGDDQGLTVDCPGGNPIALLAVGAVVTCTASDTAVAGPYVNVGDVIGNPVDENGDPLVDPAGEPVGPVEDNDPANYFGGDSAIDIEKATNGEDADVVTGPSLLVGDTVTWTYVVTNTGNLAVNEIAVADNQGVSITCPSGNPIPTLAIGASETCEATGVATDGQYENEGTANGTDENGNPVSDADLSHYIAVDPSLSLEKATNGVDADTPAGPSIAVGDPVTWTYVVTNDGSADLTTVTVTDDLVAAGDIDCGEGTNVVAALAAGDSATCTAVGVATAGQYANTGTVTGQPVDGAGDPIGDPLEATDPSHYFGGEPGLLIEKATNGVDADAVPGPILAVGEAVTWTYVVTNAGNVPLLAVTVTDDLVAAADIDCGDGTNVVATLATGDSATCTATGVAVEGQYTNTATAGATDEAGNPVPEVTDPSNYFAADPSVDVEKATNGIDADAAADAPSILVGETVTWTYVVTNDGTVDLTNVTVTDDDASVIVDCGDGTNEVANLAVDATATCTASGVATLGGYTNNATVTGDPVLPPGAPDPDPVTDEDPSNYTGTAEPLGNLGDFVWIDLNEDGVQDGGDEVGIAGVVLTLTDDTGAVVGTTTTNASGAYLFPGLPGGTYTVTVDPSTLPAGYTQTFDALAPLDDASTTTLPAGADDLDQDFGYVPPASIEIEKDTNGSQADTAAEAVTIQVGQPITWTYIVENTGLVTLTNVTVTDNVIDASAIDCGAGSNVVATLAPGDTITCTAEGVATDGAYVNEGTAAGDTPAGNSVDDVDASNYTGTPLPVGSIGDLVWFDTNRDGVRQASEAGIEGVEVVLTDGDGNQTSTLTGPNGTYLFSGLPAGDYTVSISKVTGNLPDGVVQTFDNTAPATDHTSTLTLGLGEDNRDQDFGYATPDGSIGDLIWWDANRDGESTGEDGVPGITVNLIDENGDTVATTMTDDNGNYLFTGLPGGTYTVVVDKTDTDLATAARTYDADGIADPSGNISVVVLPEGGEDLDQDFGYAAPDGVIGDLIWWDTNQDGESTGEDGVPGITVNLIDENGDTVATTMTDNNGNYLFTQVPGGTYTVAVDKAATELAAAFRTYDADGFAPPSGNISVVVLPEGGENLDQDFGYAQPASIGNFIFLDANANGIQDTGEAGVSGAVVNLFEVDPATGQPGTAVLATVTTGDDGEYEFTSLDPRIVYTVQVIPPAGSIVTDQNVGDDALDSDIDPDTGFTDQIDLSAGETNFTFDAGIVQLVPGVSFEKFTNGVDADTIADSEALVAGSTVTWTYVVTNTGGTTLINVAVNDDVEGGISCPKTTLAPAEEMSCIKTATVVLLTNPASYTNVGSVTADPADADGTPLTGLPTVQAEDPSNYTTVDATTITPVPVPPTAVPATATPVPPTAVVIVVTPTPDPKSISILFTPRPVGTLTETATPLALTGRNSTDFALVAGVLIISGAAFVALGRRRNEAEEI